MLERLSTDHPVLLALIRALLYVVPVLLLVVPAIWFERRFLGWMQDRIGPNRVGTFPQSKKLPKFLRGFRLWGLLQPLADGAKLLLKEDITPTAVDRAIYFIAPAIALFPPFAIGATLPWAPSHKEGFWKYLTPVADVNIGVLYILAISSLGVYGLVLAGYAANNKYSLMGGLRASAQLISYELAMGMSLACIVLATGSLRIPAIVQSQEEPLWGVLGPIQNWFIFTPYGLVAGIIFLICMVAETNRAPFDLPEAENELIAGYHTEYSSMKFAVFFMGEYAAMCVFSGIFSAIFLGGYNMLPFRWEWLSENAAWGAPAWSVLAWMNYYLAPLWFVTKIAIGFSFYVWLRATLPRLRYDQLMSLGWRSLLPLATTNFIVVALWIVGTRYLIEQRGIAYGAGFSFAALVVAGIVLALLWKAIYGRPKAAGQDQLESRKVQMVDPNKPGKAEVFDPSGVAS